MAQVAVPIEGPHLGVRPGAPFPARMEDDPGSRPGLQE
jgi:hypothetical protein